MRFIKLSFEDKEKLDAIFKSGTDMIERNRVHAILLSNKGRLVKDLVNIFSVSTRTIYRWFDRFEKDSNLKNKKRSGRPSILKEEHKEIVLELIKDNNVKETCASILLTLNLQVTPKMLRSFLKKWINI